MDSNYFAKYSNGQNYVTDGNTGKPEDILDGKQSTYLSMIKPGKSMGAYVGTTDPNFTVDMQQPQTFNYFIGNIGNRIMVTYRCCL